MCLISRVPNAVGAVGPEGGAVQHDTVKVTFPEGATLKTIKVGVSARRLVNPQEAARRMLPKATNATMLEFGEGGADSLLSIASSSGKYL